MGPWSRPPPTSKMSLHPLPLIDYGIRIIGSVTGNREDIAEAAEFVRKGLVKPRITEISPQDLENYAGRVDERGTTELKSRLRGLY